MHGPRYGAGEIAAAGDKWKLLPPTSPLIWRNCYLFFARPLGLIWRLSELQLLPADRNRKSQEPIWLRDQRRQ